MWWLDTLDTIVLMQLLGIRMMILLIGLSRMMFVVVVVLPSVRFLVRRKVTLEELIERVPLLMRAM